MTKTTDFKIVAIVPKAVSSKYDAHVDALIEAGEGQGIEITVPRGANKDGVPFEGSDAGRPDRVAFQRAANAKGYTARVDSQTENGDDITIVFKLTPKVERKTSEDAAESASVEDVAATE